MVLPPVLLTLCRTLKPAKLSESDYVDLSNHTCDLTVADKLVRISYSSARQKHYPFPHGTHGFFYLAHAPGLPLFASEIRFRVTDSSSPASFALSGRLATAHSSISTIYTKSPLATLPQPLRRRISPRSPHNPPAVPAEAEHPRLA